MSRPRSPLGAGTALALFDRRLAAAHKNRSLQKFPLVHGMLRANGQTVEGPRPCDGFDVFGDDEDSLVLVLMDVQSSAESPPGFLSGLLQSARQALQSHQPLHQVVCDLELQLALYPGVEAGLVILRVSQRDAKIELLNAGMPPVANASPGGRLDFYPSLSGPLGRRVGEVHPYELVPLLWGGTWLAVSDGMLNGSNDEVAVAALCATVDLPARGLLLATASTEDLHDALQAALTERRFLRDDATGVLIAADPGARFDSGIV